MRHNRGLPVATIPVGIHQREIPAVHILPCSIRNSRRFRLAGPLSHLDNRPIRRRSQAKIMLHPQKHQIHARNEVHFRALDHTPTAKIDNGQYETSSTSVLHPALHLPARRRHSAGRLFDEIFFLYLEDADLIGNSARSDIRSTSSLIQSGTNRLPARLAFLTFSSETAGFFWVLLKPPRWCFAPAIIAMGSPDLFRVPEKESSTRRSAPSNISSSEKNSPA